MRRYSSNLAFVDLLFNMLAGFLSLFVIAVLFMNPPSNPEKIDPPIEFMVEMTWNDDSEVDMDLYMLLPNKKIVYYMNKDSAPATLKRDDLGTSNDKVFMNGEVIEIRRNYEVITLSQVIDGDYVVGAHFFSPGGSTDEYEATNITMTDMKNFGTVGTRTVNIPKYGEKSFFTFSVVDGKIVNVDSKTEITGIRQLKGHHAGTTTRGEEVP